jgi:hypothetical protein
MILRKETPVKLIETITQFGKVIPRGTEGLITKVDRQHGTLKYWIMPFDCSLPVFFVYQSEIESY